MSVSRTSNISKGYIKLNLIYTMEAFLYLLAGLVAMILSFLPFSNLNRDAIYILWLFGFVGSMVFGITNIMIPSYGNRKEFKRSLIVSEIILLNTGTIAAFVTKWLFGGVPCLFRPHPLGNCYIYPCGRSFIN